MSSPTFGCINGAQKCWRFSWEWISPDVLVMESWLSFMRGGIISISTAANENAIKSSWLIILGVQNDGLGVPFSTCSIWNMGSSTTRTSFGVVIAVFLSALHLSFNFFSPVLYFHVLFPFCFWSFFLSHSFGHTLNLLLGGKLFAAFRI